MAKSKKAKSAEAADSKKGQYTYCSGCGSRGMINSKCKHCGYTSASPDKKTVSDKPVEDNKATE